MRLVLVTAAAVALALAGAGCGGDAREASDPGTGVAAKKIEVPGLGVIKASSIDRGRYIAKADAICRRSSDYMPALRRYLRQHPAPGLNYRERVADGVYAVVAKKFELQIAELAGLGAPAGDEQEIADFLSAMKHDVEGLERRDELSPKGDIEREFKPAAELARQYGISSCAFAGDDGQG